MTDKSTTELKRQRKSMFAAFSECLLNGDSMTPVQIADRLLSAAHGEQSKVAQFIVSAAERAIHEATHPTGMHTNGPAMARIEASKLAGLLRYAQAGQAGSAEQSEREAFEKWLSDKGISAIYAGDGQYENFSTQRDWEVWQARVALQSAPERKVLTDEQIRSLAEENGINFKRPMVNDEPAWFEEAQTNPDDVIAFARALLNQQGEQTAPEGWLELAQEALAAMDKAKKLLKVAGFVMEDGTISAPYNEVSEKLRAMIAAAPSTAQKSLVCKSCGADRLKEDCKGDRLICAIRGAAQKDGV